MKHVAILLVTLFVAGCDFSGHPKHYTAIVMATDMGHGSVEFATAFTKKHMDVIWLNLKTPRDEYFTVTFRASSPMRFPANKLGELRYHECGENLYCFDSFTAK